MKTLVLLTLLLSVLGLRSSRSVALGFSQLTDLLLSPDDIYHQVKLCPHSASREIDGRGHDWPRYCKVDKDDQETQLLFRRDYSESGWTYVIDQFEGRPEFQYRVVEHIAPCAGKEDEVDGLGNLWSPWCYPDGTTVSFELSTSQPWTYLQDNQGGFSPCQFRRITHASEPLEQPQFMETKWSFLWNLFGLSEDEDDELVSDIDEEVNQDTDFNYTVNPSENMYKEVVSLPSKPTESDHDSQPTDCYPLETDPSNRYFWVQFDSKGRKIAFEKDSRGNYVLSNSTHSRIPVSPLSDYEDTTGDRDISLACGITDPATGKEVTLKSDEALEGVYWPEDNKTYEPAMTPEDEAYGMYKLDEETGERILVTRP